MIARNIQPNAGRSLIEIGSHTGEFLNLARSLGWFVKGIEPDRRVAEIAIEIYGLDISISVLREAHVPTNSCDVVVLFHVIEHFYQPLEELIEIQRVLKPGGILVIETPRFDTLWFRILKERERSVIPDHYFYFTARTMNAMLKIVGIEVIQIKSVGRTLALDRLLKNVAKVIDSKSFSRFLIQVADRFQFNRITFYLNMRDMMRVYTQKPCVIPDAQIV